MDDHEDFRGFCQQATPAQLEHIIQKEADAGREAFAAIARAVRDGRH